MKLEIYRKDNELLFVEFYSCLAIIYEPSEIRETKSGYKFKPKDPTDIVVRDIPNTRMILSILCKEMGYVRRLNLMS